MPRVAPPSQFIALDDISLSPGACEAQVSCDFDFDMCSWSNIRTQMANWNWNRFTGKEKFSCLKIIINLVTSI